MKSTPSLSSSAADTQSNVPCIALMRELDLHNAGGIPFAADLDGDGQEELLFLQTPGLFHASIHGGSQNIGHDHFCLTAMNQQGRILWRIGTPWRQPEPYASHGGERSLVTCDLNADGQLEIYVIRGKELLKINAGTGDIEAVWPLPYDNFVVLCFACIGSEKADRRLLASPSNQSYDDLPHGSPTLFFDAGGNVISSHSFHGFGHDPVAVDLTGDGHDDWLVGYECRDGDGSAIWRFDPVPPDTFDDLEMHVDGLSLLRQGPTRDHRIALAASQFVFVLDLQGKLVWSHKLVHPQQVIFTHLRNDVPGPQLLVVNKRDNLELFDFHGQLLWSIPPEECWPVGKTPGVTEKFHLFDPCVKLTAGSEQGEDLIIYCEGGWPYAIDGQGRCALTFDCPVSARQPVVEGQRRPDDFGAGYQLRVLADSERHLVVINDRRRVWMYEIPRENQSLS